MSRPIGRSRDAYRHFTLITTRWADNDAYGHVNNTVYYQWFDSAVNALLVGAGLLDIVSGDPIGLVVETGCIYFAPLSFPGEIEVGLAIDRVGGSSVTYRLGIFAAGSPDLEALAIQSLVVVDSKRTLCRFDFIATGRSMRCRADSASKVPWPA